MSTKNSRKTNGHAGPHGRANGHAPASTERGGIPMLRDRAASDDVSGASVAIAASASIAASADREACAEVATPHSNGAAKGSPAEMLGGQDKDDKIPPGEGPLPELPADFVEEIHSRVDLFRD